MPIIMNVSLTRNINYWREGQDVAPGREEGDRPDDCDRSGGLGARAAVPGLQRLAYHVIPLQGDDEQGQHGRVHDAQLHIWDDFTLGNKI